MPSVRLGKRETDMKLAGKVALVTGVAGGFGAGVLPPVNGGRCV